MQHAPAINWRLAHAVAGLRPDDLPRLGARELAMLVADLRVTARRAGRIAARSLGLQEVGATRISIVDWDGWGRAVQQMADGALAEVGLAQPAPGIGTRVAAGRNAVLLGAGMRMFSRRLLGQFDAFTGSETLYLVAPTIVAHEARHRFVPGDFRLWVALHEQTHALQMRMAPWLRGHILERARAVVHDEVSLSDSLMGLARTADVAALFASEGANAALAELSAVMTFLEGHADFVADTAGRPHIRTVAAMRRAFARPQRQGLLGRLSAAFDKNAQYRDGLEFCTKVQRLRGRRALKVAFERPENLPTADEIADPAGWLKRVHGQA